MINNEITTTKGMEQAQKQMEQTKNQMALEKKKANEERRKRENAHKYMMGVWFINISQIVIALKNQK